jgi:hypothetical protein
MQPEVIIILPPVYNLQIYTCRRHKPVDVQAFISKAAIEGFDERGISWFARVVSP